MLLRDFCILDPRGYEGVSRRTGLHRGTVHKIAHGLLGYSPARGIRICAATNGAVSMEDLAAPFIDGFEFPNEPERQAASAA